MIEYLELRNFTAFTNLRLDLSPKVNVIIGENGTGKTHLLKAAYGLCSGASLIQMTHDVNKNKLEAALTTKFLRLFMPIDNKLGKMCRYSATNKTYLSAKFHQGQKISVTFSRNSKTLAILEQVNYDKYSSKAVFIPTKEVISLARGMTDKTHDQNTVELIFDDGYVDLAKALMHKGHDEIEAKVNLDPRFNTIIPDLVNLIGGRYEWTDNGFCFRAGQYKEKASPKRTKAQAAKIYQDSTIKNFVPTKGDIYSSGMTAEGFRKIGILYRLLSNGTISLDSSSPLFWDEPESNMNPKLMKSLVNIILELSRNGLQVILGTHDYVLLKWLDLLANKGQDDHVRYHLITRDNESRELKIEFADDYSIVSESAISNTFADLYDADVKRALE